MNEPLEEVLQEIRARGVAVPFAIVVAGLRRRGAAVTEPVLERALRSVGSDVRVLDPWIGPQSALRPLLADEGEGGPWVVPLGSGANALGSGASAAHPVPDARRLHQALRCLARDLDERSPGDVARWVALVQEARRYPQAA
jgi:hypothetical protein